MGARYSGFLLDPCSNLELKSADLAQNLAGPAVGNGRGLGTPGPRVPVEDIFAVTAVQVWRA